MRTITHSRAWRLVAAHAFMSVAILAIIAMEIAFYFIPSEHETGIAATMFGVMLVGSLVQGAAEFSIWLVMRTRHNQTSLGHALQNKSLSIGWKNLFRAIVDAILIFAIVLDVRLFNVRFRMSVYALVIIFTFAAVYYGFLVAKRFRDQAQIVNEAIRAEERAAALDRQRDAQDATAIIQAETTVAQAATTAVQAETELVLSERGLVLSEAGAQLQGDNTAMNARGDAMNDRRDVMDEEQTSMNVRGDAMNVRRDAMDAEQRGMDVERTELDEHQALIEETILHTDANVEEVKQDVKEIKGCVVDIEEIQSTMSDMEDKIATLEEDSQP